MQEQHDIYIFHNNQNFDALRPFVERLDRYGFKFRVEALENTSFVSTKDVDARMIVIAEGRDGARISEQPGVASSVEIWKDRGVHLAIMMLPGVPDNYTLPPSLKHAEVIDLRVDNQVNWDRFILNSLRILKVLETSRAILTGPMKLPTVPSKNQALDTVGIAAVKSRLHALSEIVARDASEEAVRASQGYPYDVLTIVVPLLIDLRWRRGYRMALERLLKIPESKKYLRDFKCEAADPPCKVDQGVLSAEVESEDTILILLANYPAAHVRQLAPADKELILDTVNKFGRLPRSKTGELSVIERIREIPVRGQPAWKDEIALTLYRNREALVPLLARFRIPGAEWLFTDDEVSTVTKHNLPAQLVREIDDKKRHATDEATTFSADAAFRNQGFLQGEDISELLFQIQGWKRSDRSE